MKKYEAVSRGALTAGVPVIIRVDGRAFHTYTRGMAKPFDAGLMDAMECAALQTAGEMQGFKAAYIQSDEASFCLTDFDTVETQGWFDYALNKLVSISASAMTARFNAIMHRERGPAMFDSRAFSIPASDVPNYFLWRAKDWARNSLQMYARAHYSHKQLHGKNSGDLHEMLHEAGKNWTTDLSARERNGVWLLRHGEGGVMRRCDILPNYPSVSEAISPLLLPKDAIEPETRATAVNLF